MIGANQHPPLAAAATYVAAANKFAPLSGAPGTTLASLIETARVLNDQVDRHQREVVDRANGQAAIRAAVADNNALGDVWVDALDEVAHHPVSTAADLRVKLAFMLENQMGDGRDWLDTISKDAARILEVRA